jgi:hypothetical protein
MIKIKNKKQLKWCLQQHAQNNRPIKTAAKRGSVYPPNPNIVAVYAWDSVNEEWIQIGSVTSVTAGYTTNGSMVYVADTPSFKYLDILLLELLQWADQILQATFGYALSWSSTKQQPTLFLSFLLSEFFYSNIVLFMRRV